MMRTVGADGRSRPCCRLNGTQSQPYWMERTTRFGYRRPTKSGSNGLRGLLQVGPTRVHSNWAKAGVRLDAVRQSIHTHTSSRLLYLHIRLYSSVSRMQESQLLVCGFGHAKRNVRQITCDSVRRNGDNECFRPAPESCENGATPPPCAIFEKAEVANNTYDVALSG